MVKKKVSKKKANKSSNNFNRNLLIGAVIIILIFVVAFNFAGKGYDEEGLAQSPPSMFEDDMFEDDMFDDNDNEMEDVDVETEMMLKIDPIEKKGYCKGLDDCDRIMKKKQCENQPSGCKWTKAGESPNDETFDKCTGGNIWCEYRADKNTCESPRNCIWLE